MSKSKSAFKTIAEVADEIGVATHVLRFWETKFKQISPVKATGGRRYYRPDDVELIKLIRNFLYDKRYTIEGVQKLFKQKGVKAFLSGDIQKDFFADETPEESSAAPQPAQKMTPAQLAKLSALKDELTSLYNDLNRFMAN
ncbi:MAG: MerR family transcriptional regulator [Alphaproteobacteria bacterium]|nr:MerR family transcriptional regulator [Alphaproteobacteria bacterium]